MTSYLKPDRAQVAALGAELREALKAVLRPLAGDPPATGELIRRFGLDKSVASRIARTAKAGHPLQVLLETPGPQGLRSLIQHAGGEPTARLSEAIVSFERLLEQMPGGRADLRTAIGGWLPAARARSERSARQLLQRGWSELVGKREDVRALSVAIAPSSDLAYCDKLAVLDVQGLRRLRAGVPITLSIASHPKGEATYETLDGRPAVDHPHELVLRGLDADAGLTTLGDRGNFWLALDEREPQVQRPVDFAIARVTRRAWRRFAIPGDPHEFENSWVRFPIGVLVTDLLLHEDIAPGAAPELTTQLGGLGVPAGPRDSTANELNRIDLDATVECLGGPGPSVDWLESMDAPRFAATVTGAMERIGWDPRRFRGYRVRIEYPTPFVWYRWWVRLPVSTPA